MSDTYPPMFISTTGSERYTRTLLVGGKKMEGILFLVFWLGAAALHTLYDLKIKPVLQSVREENDYF